MKGVRGVLVANCGGGNYTILGVHRVVGFLFSCKLFLDECSTGFELGARLH